jgi:hypothetical protein
MAEYDGRATDRDSLRALAPVVAESYDELVEQCEKMLSRTAASFVFDYSFNGMRCGAASAIVGSDD